MVLLFVYLFLALFVSFICSIMEVVLLSVPISYLKIKSGAGNKNAIAMIGLKEDIDKFLSRSEEHTSELQSRPHLVCGLLVVKKNDLASGRGRETRCGLGSLARRRSPLS